MLGSLLRSLRARDSGGAARRGAAAPRDDLLERFSMALSAVTAASLEREQTDNFDARHFPGGPESVRAQDFAQHRHTLCELIEHGVGYAGAWDLLEDETSRSLYVQLLAYRLLGHRHVRLTTHTAGYARHFEQARALPSGASSYSSALGPLRRFDVEFDGTPLALECWWASIAFLCGLRQYWYARDGVSIAPRLGDRVIDAGACLGDTALAFAASVGERGRVLALEIDPANLGVVRHNLSLNPGLAARIDARDHALGRAAGKLFRHGAGPAARVSEEPSDAPVEVTTIDALVDGGALDRVDFVKMDIEGAELAALEGARATLARFRPDLAVSLYHRLEDFREIPAFVDGLGLGYRFHLDHYTIHRDETVLYATAR